MEGKNVEENKARDKWCSLCVSCGERPRLINRRIDTRYIGGKKKLETGRRSLRKKRNHYCKSLCNDTRSVIRDEFLTVTSLFKRDLVFRSVSQCAIFAN